jgi:hypothetical protein
VRLLYRKTLLPGNVERRQWVNRHCRIKVLFNVAGENLSCIVPKLNDGGMIIMKVMIHVRSGGHFFESLKSWIHAKYQ